VAFHAIQTVRRLQRFLREPVFIDAHHLNRVECLREDFDVVDERQLFGGVDGSPYLQVDWSVADEERREVVQFSIAGEFIRQHDCRP